MSLFELGTTVSLQNNVSLFNLIHRGEGMYSLRKCGTIPEGTSVEVEETNPLNIIIGWEQNPHAVMCCTLEGYVGKVVLEDELSNATRAKHHVIMRLFQMLFPSLDTGFSEN